MTRSALRTAAPALLALAALATPSAAAHAQTPAARPLSIGISAGPSIPTGDAGDVFGTGFNVDGLVELQRPASPIAFRLELGYQRFGLKDDVREAFEQLGGDFDINARILSGVANVLYKFPVAAPVRPYALAGVGVFNLGGSANVGFVDPETGEQFEESESGSVTRFGYNLGGGVEIPLTGLTVFGEVRFQQIRAEDGSFNVVPIKVGIRF